MRVNVPEYGTFVDFPDGTDPKEIEAVLAQHFPKKATQKRQIDQIDSTPEWAGRNPNLYGLYGAGKELLRFGIETTGLTGGAAAGAFVPLPGAALVGGGAGYALAKRGAQKLFNEPVDTSFGGVATDVALGTAQSGIGKAIGMIPGLRQVVAPAIANTPNVKPVTSGLFDKAATQLAERSMKVPPATHQTVRNKVINTMLDEKIPISKGGLNKVGTLLDDLEMKMDDAVAANPNAKIRIDDVLGPVNDLKTWASKTVNGKSLSGKIDNVISGFKKQYGDEITVAQAQEIKRNTNAFLKKSYGELKPVTVEAQKQIVRGLRDKIAQEIPTITGINARYGDLKVLEKALERAVNRSGNWDLLGLTPLVAGTMVGGSTGSIGKASAAAALYQTLRNPGVQSRIAIALKNAGAGRKSNAMANALVNSIYQRISTE